MTTELKVSMAMVMATAMATAMGMAPTVMDIMKDFIEDYPADSIVFSGADKEGSDTNQREEFYKKYIIKNIHLLPYVRLARS